VKISKADGEGTCLPLNMLLATAPHGAMGVPFW